MISYSVGGNEPGPDPGLRPGLADVTALPQALPESKSISALERNSGNAPEMNFALLFVLFAILFK